VQKRFLTQKDNYLIQKDTPIFQFLTTFAAESIDNRQITLYYFNNLNQNKMKSKFTKLVGGVFLSLFMVPSTALADWTDIKVELTSDTYLTLNANLLTDDEIANKTSVTIGLNASMARVASDDASAIAVLSGKYHSNEHGWSNFSASVPVEAGTYRISMGSCAWGGDVTIKNGGTTLGSFNTNTGACYHQGKTVNIASTVVVIESAMTLTIAGGSYTPYFAVEKTTYVPDNKTLTFSLGTSGAVGDVPNAVEQDIKVSDAFTIPANFTVYKEGYTLTGWNDGTADYALGAAYTITGDVTFTPVFTANTKSFSDRTDVTVLTWDFQRKNGAPNVGWQNTSGHVWIAPATIGGKTIDVKMDVDTNPGKVANGSWTDWAQLNDKTKLTIPAAKGMTVTIVTYNPMTTTTIAGSSTYDAPSTGSTGNYSTSYTYTGTDAFVDIVIGDGSYYRTITVSYPASMVPYTITTDYGWTTFSDAGNILDFTSVTGLKAYAVTAHSGTALTMVEPDGAVATGTGLLIKADAGTYNIPIAVAATATNIADNKMVAGDGTDVDPESATKTKYALSVSGSDAVFKKITAARAIPAGKAYLVFEEVIASREMSLFFDGETTGIDNVTRETLNGKMYNLQGQEVRNAKGIVIVNGKKVIMK